MCYLSSVWFSSLLAVFWNLLRAWPCRINPVLPKLSFVFASNCPQSPERSLGLKANHIHLFSLALESVSCVGWTIWVADAKMELEVKEIYRGQSLWEIKRRGSRRRQREPSDHDTGLTSVKEKGRREGLGWKRLWCMSKKVAQRRTLPGYNGEPLHATNSMLSHWRMSRWPLVSAWILSQILKAPMARESHPFLS